MTSKKMPVAGDKVQWSGVLWRVLRRWVRADGDHYVITLEVERVK